ncbi:MAG: permease-like cell division protein FtsX [Desulfitobacteriaceae bacterium]|nr:permease-like cell division protein FtsX [Desulfitobacteriaceae bacterium]MDD4345635.1 permease-like cell division protein FtsX [Desulfitobacteriaceae bacterium]MDD4400452.1 permease-like cell division protein FtsX [Desulfitobacteriaceae bacterium]
MLNTLRYILRETFNSVKRNPWLSMASILTVMVSLVILGFSTFFLINASNLAKTFESELEIAVFLQKNMTVQQIKDLQAKIEQLPGVASVLFISQDQALVEISQILGGDQSNIIADLGGTNPLPDKFTVKVIEAQDVPNVAGQLALPGVNKVRYGQEFIEQLLKFTEWLRWVGIVVIIAFAVASIVLISINIKMNVFSRRREIQIMKLVGASNSFIRWPFFTEGMILGLIGGGLAAIIVGFAYQWLVLYIQATVAFLPVVHNNLIFWQVITGLFLSGMAIGAIGSAISLRKFLQV